MRASIKEVVKTLAEAMMLVFLVMYLFLQNLRATLIPTIAVPVVLLGTFGVLAVLGYSINMLTMFAMVLAIGLLVDDAIVVVENVERVMSEEGLSPLEATRKSMDQITGALVGIGIVLAAVFVPMAFLSGSTGVIYRQFSATIVSAMALSVLVAIVLTPALVRDAPEAAEEGRAPRRDGLLPLVQPDRSSATASATATASRTCSPAAGASWRFSSRCCCVMGVLFVRLPSAFLPARGPGQHHFAGDGAGRRDAGAHDAVDREGRAALPREREGRGHVGVRRAGFQLRRRRPEHRLALHQPEALGRAHG